MMGLKVKCEYCKKNIDAAASRCPHCQGAFSAEQMAQRKKDNKQAAIGCVVVLVLIGLIGMCSAGDSNEPTEANFGSATYSASDREPVAAIAAEPVSTLTAPQANAARSAQQYLNMSGFSRNGLISQLSSDAADGYENADATAAVDSLNVDWNEQAVRSAKQYLSISGFSCNGLIEQLSSSAADKYTKDQARYGAKQAGAC